jgi:NAD-dependent SIR2 family protein deacetylase
MMTLRRRSRRDRVAAEVRQASASQPARVALIGAGIAALLGLAYIGRRRLWQALGLVADAVEEVADTVEDAAEDVRDYARARTDGDTD